jgi:hypothetical protein
MRSMKHLRRPFGPTGPGGLRPPTYHKANYTCLTCGAVAEYLPVPTAAVPTPPFSFEEGEQTLREIRVELWLAELAREHDDTAPPLS